MQMRVIVMAAAVLAAGVLTTTATERGDPTTPGHRGEAMDRGEASRGPERAILTPDVRVRGAERVVGVKVDILALARAKRPTKSVYVEQAVALWHPGLGEQIAANEAPGTVSDVNGTVVVKETVVPKGGMEVIGDHFRRNAGRYLGTAALALLGGAAWYIYDDAQNGDAMQARASIPSAQSPSGSQAPAIVISGVNLAPGSAININIDQPYASE